MKKRCLLHTLLILTIGFPPTFLPAEVELPFGKNPSRKEVRNWINNLSQNERAEGIATFYEQIGKPVLQRTLNQKKYVAPGLSDEDTRSFVFKTTEKRNLHIFVDYPDTWQATDKRPALVFWHGGGFTQGNAGQFYHQANYFTQRGAVCFRPEYRIRDLDQTIPVSAVEDGISAIRWIKERAQEFGIDPNEIVVGGGSAGGCMASAVATVDAQKFAQLGFVGEEDNLDIDIGVKAMLLFNPFVDFFEPTHPRQIEEECLFLGKDPEDYREGLHVVSAIENLTKDSPPSIILFGTRDAFYVSDIRWIIRTKELGLKCQSYVYKGEVHSWYNNSPHLEYTTHNVNEFLIDIGFLNREPVVEMPHKSISSNRSDIQDTKYDGKKDWDELAKFKKLREDNDIPLIPFKHYEQ
ncbi:MAG: alpha/beta hydrolase fold domain-containing protein [Verrucomicrobia bacterium]|nr:alpha/beta hydrolase fold domain-containing protein [Verrucomicrobiota bacterium]MDA1066390.1 alpha/beta hydrolase fold domain-containing protein [Verrucomicrobiota bacterium]